MTFAPAVSIVTGGASGIGRSLARRLVERGGPDGAVIIADRDAEAAERTARELGPTVRAVALDVAERGAVEGLIDEVVATHGRLDLMVNNAGILAHGPVEEVQASHWDRLIAVNLRAVIDGSQAALAVMTKQARSGRTGGAILNTGSLAGLMISPRQLPYTTTKQAVVAYTRALAIESRPRGVTAHVLCPGFVDTKLLDEPLDPGAHAGSFRAYAKGLQPSLTSPDEVAETALRGIEKGKVVIPVGPFAHTLWRIERLAPALADRASGIAARKQDRKARSQGTTS